MNDIAQEVAIGLGVHVGPDGTTCGGSLADNLAAMAIDRAGNAILVGYLEGTSELDDGPLSCVEEADLFVAKIAPLGTA
ncbi:MAG: hypothetical protein JRI23_14650 [Deltaproteobacteria bacterium]|nr:hypothetical protein [Deltaproteobacteria bacterium]MBW2532989.1 hypothetical protein [Deltaproteobacteria bacterium]